MNTVIAQFDKRRDADNLAKFARELNGKIMMLNDEQWEDFVLGKLIEQAEKEGGEIPIDKILHKLQK